MKLQKYLSQAGICSRRKAEEYIAAGLVRVNDVVAHIGQIIDPESDIVKMDDLVIAEQSRLVYYAYHKPRGVVTTCLSGDPDEKGILDVISFPERVFPVGRLDKETTGLILMTNDGRLSNYLIHPRYEHQKEYIVEVYGKIEDEALEKMSRGVWIDLKENGSRNGKKWSLSGFPLSGRPEWSEVVQSWIKGGLPLHTPVSPYNPNDRWGRAGTSEQVGTKKKYKTKPCLITRLSTSRFSIILEEGKNRQIRRMVEVVGHGIKKLKRIRVENIELGTLEEGSYRSLTSSEKQILLDGIIKKELL